jgi:N4-gp56 family major capsid protein
MSPYQEHQLRTASGSEWVDFQKAAAAAEGKANPLFRGNLGMIKNVVLHSHENVVRFSTWGSGVNLPGARALFLGRQAGVIAFGDSSGMSFQWHEEQKDYKSKVNIAAGTIFGVKKTRFNSKDFGVIAVDTYAAQV